MESLRESPRPRPRPRIQTGKKTLRNRVVWSDETSEDPYSEITYTVPWGEGYAVIPTVDANGNKLSIPDALEKTLNKKLLTSSGNPLDFVTGEELPVFSTEEEANRYAQWRSDTMFDPEAIAAGFDIAPTQIFPDAPPPEVDNRSITNKVINKLNEWLAKGGIKAYRGEIEGFDKGALVETPPILDITGFKPNPDSTLVSPEALGGGESVKMGLYPDIKGLSYAEIILDSILQLENDYETNVEGIVKQFNQDRMGFLKTLGQTIYNESVEFMYSPTKIPGTEKYAPPRGEIKVAEFAVNIANELKEAVKRLSTQDLSTRLQGMFGVDYDNATAYQVSKARESVLGDALVVGEFIPAAGPVTKAINKSIPGEVKANLIGQTRALLEGDIVEFSQTSSQPPKGVGANVPGMFPDLRIEEPDLELDLEDIEFYETQDKFIDLQNQKSINFRDAFATPALVNKELDTGTDFIDSGELYRNLKDIAGGSNLQTLLIPYFRPGSASIKNDKLSDEQYTKLVNAEDSTVPGVLLDPMDDLVTLGFKKLDDVVKPEYFEKVQGDIKESVELAFKENIDRLDPTDVFTLVGLLKKQDALQNFEGSISTSEFNAVRTGVDNTIDKIVEDLKLTDNILVSDPRDYIKDAFKTPGEDVIEVTPRKKNINVDTQEPYYETAKGMYTANGEKKYRFSTVFGVEPKESGIFYGSPDGEVFSIDIEDAIKNHLRNKLNTTETIADQNFDELSDMYADQFLKNVKSFNKIPNSNLTYIAGEILTELFEKTNEKVIRGGTIVKALQNDSRVNNKTIPPYFLSNEFKNRVFKNDKKGGSGMFDLPQSDLQSLITEYIDRSPIIKYEQADSGLGRHQRQESEFGGNFTGGEAIDYKESQITVTDRDTNQSPFAPMLTHFDDRTLAHTRVSIIDPKTAPLLESIKGLELYKSIIGSEPFKLVQEIQSDLVSKGVQKFKKIKVTPETVKKIFNKPKEPFVVAGPRRVTAFNYNNRFPAYSANQDLIEKYGIDNYELDPEKGEEVFETVAAALEDLANQPDGKDVVMAKQKYDALTKKTVDAQKLKYKNLNMSEKFDMLFDYFIEDPKLFYRRQKLKNRLIANDITDEELLSSLHFSGSEISQEILDKRSFFMAYNNFKRNGVVPNTVGNVPTSDILENAKDIYMDSLRKDYAKYLNNFTSNLNGIDYDPKFNPDGIKNFSDQVKINNTALGNPSRFQDPPIKVKDTKGIEDYVSLIVQNLINNADADGIDKIVFPPVERILEARFSGKNLEYALQNKSISNTLEVTDGHPLYKTYGIILPKVLDKFEKTYGIKIYRDVELPYGRSGRDLSNKGIIIDISDMRKKFDLSRPAYAKGGTVMNEQMEMAFMKKGGIKDDGMKKDPVSGNNIPPGSMATEVRDNIPAMLSEGEYVVPADVLRYYGVNFFENLRNQAKNGLQTMEQNGRIGGTPMTQQDVARNMQQPVMANTGMMLEPEKQDAPQAMGNQTPGFNQPVQAFNTGNYTSNFSPATARLNTPMFTGTSSQLANVAAAQDNNPNAEKVTVFKKHYNTAGESIQIKYEQLPGGAMQPAPGQESELAKYPMDEIAYAAYLKGKSGSSNGSTTTTVTTPTGSSTDWMEGIDFRSSTEVQEWADKTLKTSSVIKNLGKAGGIFAAGASVAIADKIAKVNGAIMFHEKIGTDESLALAETLRKQVEEFANENESFGLDIINAIGGGTGKRYFNDLLEKENKPMQLDDFAATTTGSGKGVTASQNIVEDRKGSGMGKSTVTSTGTGADKQYTSGATRVEAGTATADEVKDIKADIIKSGGTYNIGGRNKGGLMTKGKKKKKK